MKPSSFFITTLLSTLTQTIPLALANTTITTPSTSPTLLLSNDPSFHFSLLITLGSAISGGADISPVLDAANQIIPGNMTSYSAAFHTLANATKAPASSPMNAYDPINVRDTWFSASKYFREADFYLHGNWDDPLITTLWAEQTAAFDKAIAALPVPGRRVQIRTEYRFTVEAIWYAAADPASSSKTKRPTLIIGNGFDAAQEDSYHAFVAPALARGWNCMTYEGPGQPTVRRTQNVGFRPDWEVVVTPVVDWVLAEQKDVVDGDRLVLVGNSFGGYLAARAAAFEKRLGAVVVIDGVWDVYEGFSGQLPGDLTLLFEEGKFEQFDDTIHTMREAGSFSTSLSWGLDQGLWSFHTHSPSEFFEMSKDYRLDGVVDEIDVPVFVGDAQSENFFPGQPRMVAERIGGKATLHEFEGAAGYHCQTGAGMELAVTMFGWLNETLG